MNPVKGFRYLFYLAFVVGAVLFWALFAILILGVVPFADPACNFEPQGCPPPSIWRHLASIALLLGALPATALVFVFYRSWVRRKIGLMD